MRKTKWLLLFVLVLGSFFRLYGLNWDQGFHLHPDERMIVMVTERLQLPQPFSLANLITPDSTLNPKFFPYGSLPLYLLKFVSWLLTSISGQEWDTYQYLPFIGRLLSLFFDLGMIVLVFHLGRSIFDGLIGLGAAFFYATCVFPIQLSHFYAVDVMLNFFIWLNLWCFLRLYQRPNFQNAIKAGISFALALATKVSALVLIVAGGMAFFVDLFLLIFKFWRQEQRGWWQKIKLLIGLTRREEILIRIIKRTVFLGSLVILVASLAFFTFQPYSLIDFQTFWRQIKEQHQMTKDAYVFPYTLQYVGTPPYYYQLKNMVLWGMGPALGAISFLGFIFYLIDLLNRLRRKGDYDREAQELIIISFSLIYFLLVGRFAVKFMRYFLPLYPIFILTGTKIFFHLSKRIKIFAVMFLFFHFAWLFAFLTIYSQFNPRIQASHWINRQVPPGSILAVEHWDDRLPLWGGEKYYFLVMPMYDKDFLVSKWKQIESNLNQADYLIIASNRLYLPLMKLADCQRYRVCYPKTAKYYRDLFAGRLGFRKVAEFTSYPSLRIGPWQFTIKDDIADESFTVYDHPKVMIFQKEQELFQNDL